MVCGLPLELDSQVQFAGVVIVSHRVTEVHLVSGIVLY